MNIERGSCLLLLKVVTNMYDKYLKSLTFILLYLGFTVYTLMIIFEKVCKLSSQTVAYFSLL